MQESRLVIKPYNEDLKDFKVFCFNGKAKFYKVDFGRFIDHHANYYSCDGLLQPFWETDYPQIPDMKVNLSETLPQMIKFAEQLSSDVPFLRVDFYNIRGEVYFGEITFFPAAGMGLFSPVEWNLKIGEMLQLPVCS